MPATDYQSSGGGGGLFNILPPMQTPTHPSQHNLDLDAFHRHIADRLLLLSADQPDLISLPWLRNLLDAFLSSHHHFTLLLYNHRSAAATSPLDRMVSDYFDRTVKALDICNAIRDGIEQIRQWQRLIDIVLAALPSSPSSAIGDGHFRRANKALLDLTVSMLDEKDAGGAAAIAHRNRSFGRNSSSSASGHGSQRRHFRSMSWSVSRSWSAARQLQAMASNVAAPRGGAGADGMAMAVYAANSVVVFTMWALVAAIPCQDRGGLQQVHFPTAPRQLPWAVPMAALHDRILEESRRRERRNACGLLREIGGVERWSRALLEVTESAVEFPMGEERAAEVRARVEELSKVCESLKDGLDPLERQVREVFHRIVRSRTDGLDSLPVAVN